MHVPPNGMPTLYPSLSYRDAPAAIAWLKQALGFEELAVHAEADGTVAHAELRLGNGVLMLGSVREADEGRRQRTPYVYAADVDAHCARARAAGAEVTMEPRENDYGGRSYAARDPEGNEWWVGSYAPEPAHA